MGVPTAAEVAEKAVAVAVAVEGKREQRRRRHHLSNAYTQRSSKVLSLQLSRQACGSVEAASCSFDARRQLFTISRMEPGRHRPWAYTHPAVYIHSHTSWNWRFVKIIIEMKTSMM